MYDKSDLGRIKDSASIVDVARHYISCSKMGGLYKALCPFHHETTPSFVIYENNASYHCFGCGAHGDVISFIMGIQNCSFRDAVEWLANRYGITLGDNSSLAVSDRDMKNRLRDCLKEVSKIFNLILFYTKSGRRSVNYLIEERKFDLSDLVRFGVGFCPEADVKSVFPKIPISLLQDSGVARASGQLFFSGRVVFPISTWSGNVVGFTGRNMDATKRNSKYVNTPETSLFKKSGLFFPMNFFKQELIKKKFVFLVEGPLDAIRLIQNGFSTTLSLLGSSLTEHHVRQLQKWGVERAYLALDGDEAGIAACKKWGNLLIQNLVDVRVIQLPKGSDPDSFVLEHGSNGWNERFESAVDYVSFLFHRAFPRTPNFSEKTKWVKEMLRLCESWTDPILKQAALERIIELSQVELVRSSEVRRVAKSKEIDSKDCASSLLEKEFIRLAVPLMFLDSCLAKRGLELVEEHMLFDPCWKRVKIAMSQMQKKEASGSAAFLLLLTREDAIEVEKLGRLDCSVDRAREFFKCICKELVKRSWSLQRDQIKMEIQAGKLRAEEALSAASKLARMGQTPPEITF
ncbi:DNA primase [Candidatus Similichlamydia epinepheli]|uniref:DNA primase n=1 Tax=Candidatus Similichlamydia epinepheli TaxID=1903953 RepID=UPI000D3CEF17|nr:DNA primase [Candidatus Similichlamydia epinepheli]